MCLESFEKEIDNTLFRTYEKRLSTFKKWKGKLKPEVLARSGFYYLSIQDVCKCFYCGAEIFDWTYDDCPIEEHYRHFRNCDLIECLWRSGNTTCEEPIKFKAEVAIFIFFILINIIVSIICKYY